jgi:hypothetical protein
MERGLVTHDEFETLAQTHHPAIHDISAEALAATQQRLRDLRAKERTLSRNMQRAIRGKGEQRGSNFPGNADKPAQRKQVFAHALKRVNGELARRRMIVARDALREALALKKGARRHHPSAGLRGRDGMNPIESGRARTTVQPAKVGSISQATKNAQAARDNRG